MSDEETVALKARLEERKRQRMAEKAVGGSSDSASTTAGSTTVGTATPAESVAGAEKRTKADRERARRERKRAAAKAAALNAPSAAGHLVFGHEWVGGNTTKQTQAINWFCGVLRLTRWSRTWP